MLQRFACSLARVLLGREVFDEFPDTFVNIDLKGADPDGVLLRKVHDLIVAKNREALTCWGSFNDKTVQACYAGECCSHSVPHAEYHLCLTLAPDGGVMWFAANPNIPVMFSARRTFVLLGLFYTGLLPFIPM